MTPKEEIEELKAIYMDPDLDIWDEEYVEIPRDRLRQMFLVAESAAERVETLEAALRKIANPLQAGHSPCWATDVARRALDCNIS